MRSRDPISLLPVDKQLMLVCGNASGRSLRRPRTDSLGYDVEIGVYNGRELDPGYCPEFRSEEDVAATEGVPYFPGFANSWPETSSLMELDEVDRRRIDAARRNQQCSTASIEPQIRKRAKSATNSISAR